MWRGLSSKRQGDFGLGSAIQFFTSKGITVCLPLTDSQPYDLVVDLDGLKRVQVKTTACKVGPSYLVNLRTRSKLGVGRKDSPLADSVDLVFVLTDKGARYLIPSEDLTSRAQFYLGRQYDRFKV